MVITETAPAKINLFLHVTGRRGDGYHLLESLVVFADIGDTVRVARANDLELKIYGPFAGDVPIGSDNLVTKAAAHLATLLDRRPETTIELEKALPVAAGIGGGSTDAAACIRALMKLWGEELDPLRLQDMALQLGADVPVCLACRPAWMTGVGEQLCFDVQLPDLPVLLVNPRVAVPTGKVFSKLPPRSGDPVPRSSVSFDSATLLGFLHETRNDLELAAIEIAPIIADVLTAQRKLRGCRLARMSGSGATCFAVFDAVAERDSAARRLTQRHPEWWVQPAMCRGA